MRDSRRLDELVESVGAALLLDRAVCRQEAERFDSSIMARRYPTAYRRLIGSRSAMPIGAHRRERIRQAS
ncbi:MAG: hypothetical protein ACRDZM_01140 [Acidimicrobiia bacterium]